MITSIELQTNVTVVAVKASSDEQKFNWLYK